MKKIAKLDSLKTVKTRVVRIQSQDKNGNLVDQTILINEDMFHDESIKTNYQQELLFHIKIFPRFLVLSLSYIFGVRKSVLDKPYLNSLNSFADNLPISWGKLVKVSTADYQVRINELWHAGNYRSAKWNQKLAWLCALSNLGHYLWLKAWKPVSTVFRRLL